MFDILFQIINQNKILISKILIRLIKTIRLVSFNKLLRLARVSNLIADFILRKEGFNVF